MKLLKAFIFCVSLILFSVHGHAQDVSINGKVIDEKGLPVPGATILLKGTTSSVSTDFDGQFQINAPKSGVLTVSFIGYKTVEVAINGQAKLQVKMYTSSQDLNEVVVVGYGTQKKSVNTGAISSIKGKDIEKLPVGRVEQALQGRVSGVIVSANSGQPGSSSTVRIRGLTTFDASGGNDPIWVVDGVLVDSGGIGFVNQSDIESIEVLKDAASLAIYGARAASGVILLTTKKGKAGKMSVSYSGYTGTSAPAKTLNLLNATQYGALMNEKAGAAGQPIPYTDLSVLGAGTDWQKAIFSNNAMRVSHELSVSGGNDVSTFYASVGYQNTDGIVSKEISNFSKTTFRLNSTHKLSKLFTLGQTFGFTHSKGVGIGNTNSVFGGPLSSAINLDPTTSIVVTDPVDANTSWYTNNPTAIRDENGNLYGISRVVGQEMSNPLAYAKTRLGNYNWSDDYVGNVYVEFSPIKDLKFKSSFGAKEAFWGDESFTPQFYLGANVLSSENNKSRSTNKTFAWNLENTLTYKKSFGNHNLTVLLGQGAYSDNVTSGSGITVKNLPTNNYQDASFNFQTKVIDRTGYGYNNQEHRINSLFVRLNYDYNEKYMFTGIIRRDGSTNFGENFKYGSFPSFSAGWVVSKEEFWKENSIVNTLKMRAGYGVTGNDRIGENRFLSLIDGGRNYTYGYPGTIVVGYSPAAPANPDLKWEETAQLNIGFDAKVLNDFNLTLEYYEKKTSGILQYVGLPGYLGAAGSPAGNVANMNNSGIEVELGYRKKIGEVNFSANGNFSTLKNEVTNVGLNKTFITDNAASIHNLGNLTRTEVGQSYNNFYGFKTAGIFQTVDEVNAYKNAAGGLIQPKAVPGDFRWTDTNGDGQINNDDKQYLGSPLPKYTFGLTMNLDYKGVDFMVAMQGAAGNKIFQALRRLDILNANYQTLALSRWNGAGTSDTYPRLTNNDLNENFSSVSDFYLEKGDYLRFKIIQLGYSLPSDIIGKIGANKLRFYVTGENLITLTKYTGYDPEIGGNVLGIDQGYYPQAKTFLFGVQIQF